MSQTINSYKVLIQTLPRRDSTTLSSNHTESTSTHRSQIDKRAGDRGQEKERKKNLLGADVVGTQGVLLQLGVQGLQIGSVHSAHDGNEGGEDAGSLGTDVGGGVTAQLTQNLLGFLSGLAGDLRLVSVLVHQGGSLRHGWTHKESSRVRQQ